MRTVSLLVVGLLAAASAAPAEGPQVLRYENYNDGLGNYNFSFMTSDGIERQEHSEVINAGDPEKEYVIVRGYFSYIGPDGVTYTVTYSSDENGFHPQGGHLPIPVETLEKMLIQQGGGGAGFSSGGSGQIATSDTFVLGGPLSRSLTG